MGANYSVYKLPYISSAISVDTENLKKCLSKASATSAPELRACITNNISSKTPNVAKTENLHVTYFGPGETVNKSNGQNIITHAKFLPNSYCLEKFDSINGENNVDNNSSIFCFNGTFTILIIFVLIFLLIFINVNSKNTAE